ncbi:MAG: hypothetical protein TREMPRED_005220 [Tremellales sp. Tagirdzhanova-0007]|nr:MAG: hypothetical protein TREMPRED_005220 [Tremellales sp. Tagirdzhanova-0007]
MSRNSNVIADDESEEDLGANDRLMQEDIIEVHEDSGDERMEDEEDDNTGFGGEIIIGGPGPGEDDAEMYTGQEDAAKQDNSWGSIFTLSLHPNFPRPSLAITGGEDDVAYIFSPIPSASASFSPVKLTGHTDSVVATGWNFDGGMVATGGMDGRVRVWRRAKPRKNSTDGQGKTGTDNTDWRDWEFLTSLDPGSEIQWLTWHPAGNVLACGCEDSSVWLWKLPAGNTLTVLSSHTLPSTAGLFPPPLGRHLLTTSLDSTLILWEISSSTSVFKASIFCPANSPELDPSSHGITSLAVSPSGQLAAVGGANGAVKLVNLTKGDVVADLKGHTEGESVEALVFVDLLAGAGGGKGMVLVSGGTDGKGFVWDVATGRVRAELVHDEPITSLASHPPPCLHLVTSASADSSLKTWDIRTGALLATHYGHTGIVNGVAVAQGSSSTDAEQVDTGQVVVSAGDEGVSLIWQITQE